ncbi:hypothetical protein [Streptomyces sp. Isolate_45]|uniref:hypothetical protein n=1 Tax=Streptomyces sp. Isolate_45 TaxID=2950111 RepID=UPI002481F058|nr:hypothetical protein [Streptomyces sp. Isolate_45]MDA5283888.1 hypothetical protein [Streptomyces sp. Isolate_45]
MSVPYAPASNIERQPGWSWLDEYLWVTCDIVADLAEGRLAQRPLVATTARLEPGERTLAVGPATCLTWRSLGNGSYTHESVAAFGSPALVLLSMAGSALGNSSRRRAAAQAAQPRWVMDGSGEITVTTRKVYFGYPRGSFSLYWGGLEAIDLVAPEVFQTSYRSIRDGRQTTIRLQTPWASLLFVLAATAGFPAHPRLLGQGWLPLDFERRCIRFGRPFRPASRLLLHEA